MRLPLLKPILFLCLLALAGSAFTGCDSDDNDPTPSTVPGLATVESDASVAVTFGRLGDMLDAAPPISIVARIDHAANAPDGDLRPTRVILFGNPMLGTPIMQENQVAGIDLPQKFLVYEDADGNVFAAYNTTDYLARRHDVGGVATLDQIAGALEMLAESATNGTVRLAGSASISSGEGLVSVESDAGAERTFARLRSAVASNPNLTIMAELDHAANAASVGMELRPTKLLVFGNPNLGTPLMLAEQTIGIDLPQKVLVYTDEDGDTFVVYNNPAYLAERHGITGQGNVIETISGALANLAAAATTDP